MELKINNTMDYTDCELCDFNPETCLLFVFSACEAGTYYINEEDGYESESEE